MLALQGRARQQARAQPSGKPNTLQFSQRFFAPGRATILEKQSLAGASCALQARSHNYFPAIISAPTSTRITELTHTRILISRRPRLSCEAHWGRVIA